MAKRWPPILGVTGFDGGSKPAISLATLKSLRKEGEGQPFTGACCVDGDCSETTFAECAAVGGEYQGDGVPCDPNPCGAIVCPCVTFSGVEFCCDPTVGLGPGDYPGFEFNDRLIRQVATISVGGCPYCTVSTDCDDVPYEVGIFDCDGNIVASTTILTFIAFIGGVWYILAETSDYGFLFYGTTTDLGIPADNQLLECDFTGGFVLDNPLTDCVFGGPATDLVNGFNGTATLSECPPCP